jgi:hypothetical protein
VQGHWKYLSQWHAECQRERTSGPIVRRRLGATDFENNRPQVHGAGAGSGSMARETRCRYFGDV